MPVDVFSRYTRDQAFTRSRPVVRLFESGTAFVSRSEAKRLLEGLDRFEEVDLDFTGVTELGQGFVDAVFRVWPAAHPGTRFVPLGMNSAVEFMVRRGLPVG